MKNILFICESYKHKASPNGICVEKVACSLSKGGYGVSVVTLYNDVNQKPHECIDGVDVYRVDAGYVETALFEAAADPTEKGKRKKQRALTVSKLNGFAHAAVYPLLSERQVRHLTKKAEEVYAEKHFECVVAVYHKIADVLAGINIKKKHPETKLVLYTLDAISGGWVPNILHSHTLPMKSLKRWERYFFKHIDKMFAMESHRRYYESHEEYRQYAEKIEYLDIPLLLENGCIRTAPSDGMVHAVYTGSMHPSSANPAYFLKLLPSLPNVIFDIYGSVSEEIMTLLTNDPLFGERILLHGRVSHDEIEQIQKNADILLNFGNANPNMIPCKIFEYMSTGNRIISFTHSESDSSLPYMEKYPNAVIIHETSEEIEQNVARLRQFSEEPAVECNAQTLEFFEKNTPAYFAIKLFEM